MSIDPCDEDYEFDDSDEDQLRLFEWHERHAVTTRQWAPRRPIDVHVNPKYL